MQFNITADGTIISTTNGFHLVDKSNVQLIRPLAEKIWLKTYGSIITEEQIAYMLPMMYSNERIFGEIEQGYVWELYVENNQLLGYLDYKLMEDNRVFLSKIYVDTDQQQKGVGKVMLARVIDYAKAQKATAVYLTVNKQNTKAISFYERNGLKCIKSETFDIGNGYVMDDYIYQYDI